ncbi:hypothetical protein [Halovivax gelatinilyticus]|uniref:hypothetical protein n=1 Tax=Halovivax gelatinilyticus TaxID=2961597 RepID=UPI0020CA6058|nr:hypothetical protein [Halovivax gelatinilyticus]
MSAVPDQLSTDDLAVRYATAGDPDWVTILARADANGMAVPVLEHLYATADDRVAAETADAAASWTTAQSYDSATRRYLAAELRRRRARLEQFHLDLAVVDDLLRERAIPYAVIKTNVDHPYRPWDLNVLVPERYWERVDMLLAGRGWERTTLRDHPLARSEPGKRLYEHPIRHPVHLHREVSWNGLTYLPAETVLETRIRDDGVSYPDPVTDATIHAAHAVFENFSIDLVECAAIVRHLGDGPGPHTADGDSDDGRALADANGWATGYDLAVDAAYDVVSELERSPDTVTLPHAFSTQSLVRAWLEHARETEGGWYELPLNLALATIK